MFAVIKARRDVDELSTQVVDLTPTVMGGCDGDGQQVTEGKG